MVQQLDHSTKSCTRLLIWLRQMPPHSGHRSRLFTAGWLLLQRILYAHQHHRLTWSVFCSAWCILCIGRRSSMQQSLEMCACLKLDQKVCVCYVGLLCENWAVCLCLTAAFKQFSFVLLKNNGWFLLFGLCGNMMLLARKVCVPEQITRHSVIQKLRTIKKTI